MSQMVLEDGSPKSMSLGLHPEAPWGDLWVASFSSLSLPVLLALKLRLPHPCLRGHNGFFLLCVSEFLLIDTCE